MVSSEFRNSLHQKFLERQGKQSQRLRFEDKPEHVPFTRNEPPIRPFRSRSPPGIGQLAARLRNDKTILNKYATTSVFSQPKPLGTAVRPLNLSPIKRFRDYVPGSSSLSLRPTLTYKARVTPPLRRSHVPNQPLYRVAKPEQKPDSSLKASLFDKIFKSINPFSSISTESEAERFKYTAEKLYGVSTQSELSSQAEPPRYTQSYKHSLGSHRSDLPQSYLAVNANSIAEIHSLERERERIRAERRELEELTRALQQQYMDDLKQKEEELLRERRARNLTESELEAKLAHQKRENELREQRLKESLDEKLRAKEAEDEQRYAKLMETLEQKERQRQADERMRMERDVLWNEQQEKLEREIKRQAAESERKLQKLEEEAERRERKFKEIEETARREQKLMEIEEEAKRREQKLKQIDEAARREQKLKHIEEAKRREQRALSKKRYELRELMNEATANIKTNTSPRKVRISPRNTSSERASHADEYKLRYEQKKRSDKEWLKQEYEVQLAAYLPTTGYDFKRFKIKFERSHLKYQTDEIKRKQNDHHVRLLELVDSVSDSELERYFKEAATPQPGTAKGDPNNAVFGEINTKLYEAYQYLQDLLNRGTILLDDYTTLALIKEDLSLFKGVIAKWTVREELKVDACGLEIMALENASRREMLVQLMEKYIPEPPSRVTAKETDHFEQCLSALKNLLTMNDLQEQLIYLEELVRRLEKDNYSTNGDVDSELSSAMLLSPVQINLRDFS
ncbi:hypothetical protein BABINDRAFT_162657 [Babjeviella inositovora NRRL Y-12698]|uniref:Uncharacterized protein n=1 Tax=Babjeviella inositovora NRRL Y-12698 TaxID=984486 RepID=A0A1E3QLA4_9ASCO|nr:uncharacterized protein BABINDRAFT_162657 [Babjeviella inositovora NRRL Y-12698]ODQ78430.1 hypothetical protein BABINDRAFT_162657 [Babjeviella inositovora NRRL Y-12698]